MFNFVTVCIWNYRVPAVHCSAVVKEDWNEKGRLISKGVSQRNLYFRLCFKDPSENIVDYVTSFSVDNKEDFNRLLTVKLSWEEYSIFNF